MSTASQPETPPRAGLAFTFGITGHRILPEGEEARLAGELAWVFRLVMAHVSGIGQRHPRLYDADVPRFRLLSPLAQGADQLAARVAREAGIALDAVLPFPRDVYAGDFGMEGLAGFDALLEQADAVWALPNRRQEKTRGYMLAGEATVSQADLLIAIWDGEDARGRGGTAEIVDLAVRRWVPVIHIPVDPAQAPAILWAGFDALAPGFLLREDAPRRPLDDAALAAMLDALLSPTREAADLARFLAETESRVRWRPEWALLKALTGVERLGRSAWRGAAYGAAARDEWSAYGEGAARACRAPLPPMPTLERAFAWADGLAQHYAILFRSGVVLNFFGAAIAVILALLAMLFPHAKLPLLVAELAIVAVVVLNTAFGTRCQWHRRWLDYRYLAEQLRPMRSLKLLGASSRLTRTGDGGRWTDCYAQAIWRTLGLPPTLADDAALGALARHIAAHELEGQIAYHRTAAHRMHHLDHRLHGIGQTLLVLTILIGIATLAGLIFFYPQVKSATPLLGMLSAALPTLGAAIFGIRGAGDFAGAAGRSAETARRLEHVAALLRRDDLQPSMAARLGEEAAAIMLADLAEWRSSYTHRKLAIPA